MPRLASCGGDGDESLRGSAALLFLLCGHGPGLQLFLRPRSLAAPGHWGEAQSLACAVNLYACASGVISVSMSPPESRPASIWNRFWSPKSFLEQVPPAASAEEGDAIAQRNNLWLKTYMDMYILRWGGLWAASLALTLLLVDVAGLLFVLALASNLAAFVGLVAMILIYRRASRAVQDRSQKDGKR